MPKNLIYNGSDLDKRPAYDSQDQKGLQRANNHYMSLETGPRNDRLIPEHQLMNSGRRHTNKQINDVLAVKHRQMHGLAIN